MWLSLFVLLLIVAITYFQTIHGLFSAVLFCVMAMLSCAFAFAIHEYVAATMLASWKPDFALSLALGFCFAVPLIILRVIGDSLINRDCGIPRILDLAGAGVCGLVTAVIICGTLATSLQLLPFGGPILGFQGVEFKTEDYSGTKDDITESGLWCSPDRAAVKFASSVSSGIFSGDHAWKALHPDYIQEISWAQTVPLGVRIYLPPDSVRVLGTDSVPYLYRRLTASNESYEYEAIDPQGGNKFWTVQLKADGAKASDTDKRQRYSLFQVILVGTLNDRPVQYHATAVRDDRDPRYYIVDTRTGKTSLPTLFETQLMNVDKEVAVAFEVPANFKARYLRYKLGTPVDISLRDSSGDKAPLPTRPDSNSSADARPSRTPPADLPGRTHGANVGDADFVTKLPYAMTNYSSPKGDLEERGGKVSKGSFLGKYDDQTGSGGLTELAVPEGKACLRINAKALQAGSVLGQAKSFAVRTLKNYIVSDDKGNQYKICGQIAKARVGPELWIEGQWYPESMGSIGGLTPFSKVKDRNLKGPEYELYLLFCVDSGAKMMRFSTSGSRGGQDISGLNLVAP